MGLFKKLANHVDAQTAAAEAASTVAMPVLGDTVTLEDSPRARAVLTTHAHREGLTLPREVGESHGFGVRVIVERNRNQPGGARNAVNWVIGHDVVATWTFEDAAEEIAKLDRLGADRGDYAGVMYRGRNGSWRVRIKM